MTPSGTRAAHGTVERHNASPVDVGQDGIDKSPREDTWKCWNGRCKRGSDIRDRANSRVKPLSTQTSLTSIGQCKCPTSASRVAALYHVRTLDLSVVASIANAKTWLMHCRARRAVSYLPFALARARAERTSGARISAIGRGPSSGITCCRSHRFLAVVVSANRGRCSSSHSPATAWKVLVAAT